MSFHQSVVPPVVLLSGSLCTSTVPSLSSNIVPGVPNGGGFVSGVQGDAVTVFARTPDDFGRPIGGRGVIADVGWVGAAAWAGAAAPIR